MSGDRSRASGLYRRLLGLYPAEFRARHAEDMTQLFEDQVRDAQRAGGKTGVAAAVVRAVGDVLVTATAQRISGSRSVGHSAAVAPPGWTRALGLFGIVGGLVLVAAFLPNLQLSPDLFNLRLVLFSAGAIAVVVVVHRRNALVSRRIALAAAVPAIVANTWYLAMVIVSIGRPQPPAADPDFRLLMFGAGAAMWLADAVFGLVTLRLGGAVRLGALALAAGSLLALTGMDRLELVRGDAAWLFVPAALAGIALNGAGWILLGLDVATRRVTSPGGGGPRRSRGIIALIAVYSLAFAGSLTMLANPDPDRWTGWGPTGLALGLAVSIVGLGAALDSRRAGLLIGLAGAAVAMAAMPWALYLFVAAPAVLAYRFVNDRPTVLGDAAA